VVLIAGCTGGMGSILLGNLDRAGSFQGESIALIIALDYFKDTANGPAQLQASLKTPSLVLHWDAARIESTKEVTRQIDGAVSRLDAALITTGLGFHGDLADMDLEASDKVLQRLMQVNAIGPSLLSQYCAAKMRGGLNGLRRGRLAPTLMLMSSYSGLVGLAHRAAYCSSKFALNGFLETVHAEYPELRIVLVCPTSVSTGFRDNWKKDLAKQGVDAKAVEVNKADLTAEDCVAAVWASFDCPTSTAVPGLTYEVLPTGVTAASYWLLRLPFVGERFVRPRILAKSSKL